MRKHLNLRANIALGLTFTFLANILGPIPSVQAYDLVLPAPGQMVALSPAFDPAVLKGIKLDPQNPFRFHFFVDKGDGNLNQAELKNESAKLIKYFLASLTIPEKDLWVNLSPYEKDRIVPIEFGQTGMGRDLLAEDYILKQITASLIYPESQLGKEFWQKVYAQAEAKYGTTNIPFNTFNKVWIVPDKAVVYENGGTAFVLENHLKVMLEEDYLALSKNECRGDSCNRPNIGRTQGSPLQNDTHTLASHIIREIVIPALTKEVNEGKNFSQLRQVFYSLILATWYKKKIKDSILNKVYSNQKKTQNLSFPNASIGNPQYIYQQYLKAFKKGVYNYIKEEPDAVTGQSIPRKYFSGGFTAGDISQAMITVNLAQANPAELTALQNEHMEDALTDLGVTSQIKKITKKYLLQEKLKKIVIGLFTSYEGFRKFPAPIASSDMTSQDMVIGLRSAGFLLQPDLNFKREIVAEAHQLLSHAVTIEDPDHLLIATAASVEILSHSSAFTSDKIMEARIRLRTWIENNCTTEQGRIGILNEDPQIAVYFAQAALHFLEKDDPQRPLAYALLVDALKITSHSARINVFLALKEAKQNNFYPVQDADYAKAEAFVDTYLEHFNILRQPDGVNGMDLGPERLIYTILAFRLKEDELKSDPVFQNNVQTLVSNAATGALAVDQVFDVLTPLEHPWFFKDTPIPAKVNEAMMVEGLSVAERNSLTNIIDRYLAINILKSDVRLDIIDLRDNIKDANTWIKLLEATDLNSYGYSLNKTERERLFWFIKLTRLNNKRIQIKALRSSSENSLFNYLQHAKMFTARPKVIDAFISNLGNIPDVGHLFVDLTTVALDKVSMDAIREVAAAEDRTRELQQRINNELRSVVISPAHPFKTISVNLLIANDADWHFHQNILKKQGFLPIKSKNEINGNKKRLDLFFIVDDQNIQQPFLLQGIGNEIHRFAPDIDLDPNGAMVGADFDKDNIDGVPIDVWIKDKLKFRVKGQELHLVPLTKELLLKKQKRFFKLLNLISSTMNFDLERDIVQIADDPGRFDPALSFAVINSNGNPVAMGISHPKKHVGEISSTGRTDKPVYFSKLAVDPYFQGTIVVSWLQIYRYENAINKGYSRVYWQSSLNVDLTKPGTERTEPYYKKTNAKLIGKRKAPPGSDNSHITVHDFYRPLKDALKDMRLLFVNEYLQQRAVEDVKNRDVLVLVLRLLNSQISTESDELKDSPLHQDVLRVFGTDDRHIQALVEHKIRSGKLKGIVEQRLRDLAMTQNPQIDRENYLRQQIMGKTWEADKQIPLEIREAIFELLPPQLVHEVSERNDTMHNVFKAENLNYNNDIQYVDPTRLFWSAWGSGIRFRGPGFDIVLRARQSTLEIGIGSMEKFTAALEAYPEMKSKGSRVFRWWLKHQVEPFALRLGFNSVAFSNITDYPASALSDDKYFHVIGNEYSKFLTKPAGSKAMLGGPGGIDLNPAQMSMQIKKQGADFKFDFNGIRIDAAQVTGVTFTIRTLTPVTNLPQILGLNLEPADKQDQTKLAKV